MKKKRRTEWVVNIRLTRYQIEKQWNLLCTAVVTTKNQRKPILATSDDYHFGIVGLGKPFCCFNALPFQEGRRNILGNNSLKISNTLRFYSLSLGFLPLLGEYEFHPGAFLFGLGLLFDRRRKFLGELDVLQQDIFYDNSS